jgi:hypothetical protein
MEELNGLCNKRKVVLCKRILGGGAPLALPSHCPDRVQCSVVTAASTASSMPPASTMKASTAHSASSVEASATHSMGAAACPVEAFTSHSMRAACPVEAFTSHSMRAACPVEAFAPMEALASAESAVTPNTGEAAVPGMPRPVIHAVRDVVVVVGFMTLPITKVPPITMAHITSVFPTAVAHVASVFSAIVASVASVFAVAPIAKVPPITMLPVTIPIAKVIKVSIKIMVAEEENRRKVHIER